MKLIPLFLVVGMLAVSGWAEDAKPEPYSPELVKRAKAGDAKAQFDLGLCYVRADGVNKDNKEFLKWLTKSAKQGYAPAQCNLGRCYYYAMGIKKDYEEASPASQITKNASLQKHDQSPTLSRFKTYPLSHHQKTQQPRRLPKA
ncbi:MAG: tetratricopeptide repeat protein [Verrucomicrobia bacterium]|nr:tetratricopeptide repeat protein [Verrucomicrobiota bacterium]